MSLLLHSMHFVCFGFLIFLFISIIILIRNRCRFVSSTKIEWISFFRRKQSQIKMTAQLQTERSERIKIDGAKRTTTGDNKNEKEKRACTVRSGRGSRVNIVAERKNEWVSERARKRKQAREHCECVNV